MGFKFFVEIIRPFNCIMASIAVFIGYFIATGKIGFELSLLYAVLAAFFICAGGQVINDFFDIEIDRKIRPQKILPTKKISLHTALVYAIALFLFGLFLAALINDISFIIATAFTTLLILYSAFIQKQKFLGNIVVALGTAFTLIFGASVVQNYDVVLILAASAFFANMGREITKDLQDKKADAGHKKTLPMIFKETHVGLIILFFYLLAILIALYLWFTGIFGGVKYFVLILISAVIFLQSFNLLRLKNFKKSQKWSKIAMAISLTAFLSGVI